MNGGMFLEVFVVNDCRGCVAAVTTSCTHSRTNDICEVLTRTAAKNLEGCLKSLFFDF